MLQCDCKSPSGNVIELTNDGNALNCTGVALKFECQNCEKLFDYDAHLNHICEYDCDKKRISYGDNVDAVNMFETNNVMALIRDNVAQLNMLINEFPDEIVAAEGNGTINSTAKAAKSHVCKICKRSYVHGTGLARHMKSHGANTEKILRVRPVNTKQNVTAKVVCHCLFCGRIFSTVSEALKHYANDHNGVHPNVDAEKENEPSNVNDQNFGEKVIRLLLYFLLVPLILRNKM